MVSRALASPILFTLLVAKASPCCFAWGEERVFFSDPQTHEIRSLPLAWTSLAHPDPFLVTAHGTTVLRFEDLQHLLQALKAKPLSDQEDH